MASRNAPIILGGRQLNLTRIAEAQSMDPSYLSRIFSGKRDPGRMSISQAQKLAAAVHMGLEEMIEAIYERRDALRHAA